MFNLQRGAKGWNDHYVIFCEFLPGNKLGSIRIHNEPDTPGFKIRIYFLIVNHLAQEINVFASGFFECPIGDFNGIFNAITEAKMSCQNKLNRPEIQHSGRKILLAQIF